MIDGKIEDTESGTVMAMWGNTLMRGAVRTALKLQQKDGEETTEENKEESDVETKPQAEEAEAQKHGELHSFSNKG
ncbi:unnamed protein product [Strongylus vulgaris]|uniref:Uncharacterized protein n=1 Tax=Strongylus vulgaris TaxID=40348 RepID=A0A3P7L6D6_STRVU|nr:unnamed protein product [Strongylus vulgaris]